MIDRLVSTLIGGIDRLIDRVLDLSIDDRFVYSCLDGVLWPSYSSSYSLTVSNIFVTLCVCCVLSVYDHT